MPSSNWEPLVLVGCMEGRTGGFLEEIRKHRSSFTHRAATLMLLTNANLG